MSQARMLPDVPELAKDSVLLHIGVHKTGTTAIQAALADAREDLAAHGIRYPGKLQAQHRAALALLGRPWGWNSRGGAVMDRRHFDTLVRRTANHDGRVVISSEFFCEAPPDKAIETVEALGGSDKVTVVVTLRNLGALLPSSWQQYLKYGLTTPYEKWLEDVFAEPGSSKISPTFWRRHDHGAVITRWANAVGAANIRVLVLEDVDRSAQFRAFAQMMGVPDEILVSRMDLTSNRSMTAAEAELLVRLNKRVKKQMQWTDYVRLVRRGVALRMVEGRDPGPDEPRLVTPDWALDAAAVQGAISVETIASLGVEVFGNLEALGVRAPSSPEPASSPDQMPIDAAVAAVAAVIDASREDPSSRELAGRTWRQVRKDGVRSLLDKSDS
ncbi:hypothetical protein OA174_04460 [Actinomycetota bacterium]|nr:hypothetical protein [Actinomycetota bacterium]|tara:strand:+ start:4356 stop:5513 length:1158 start_codon:yes stop_codon:yes gene_type:complete